MSAAQRPGPTLFLDLASLDRGDLDLSPLKREAEPLLCFDQITPAELSNCQPDAWCVIVNKVKLERAFFAARPQLRLVCVVATGTNNVDLEAAADHGVAVVNCRDYGTASLAQHVLMLILALSRSLPQYQNDVADGAWSRSPLFCLLDHPIRELGGLTLGIVGYGAIGQRVAQLGEALGMRVIIAERMNHTPRAGRVAFADVISQCDVLSLHCPLSEENRGMINEARLRRMRRNAILINTARGGLVDEEALVRALREGWIAGAGVDVLNDEPPAEDNPLMSARLNNLIITPHCAWGSREARQRIVEQTAENISAYLRDESLRRVV